MRPAYTVRPQIDAAHIIYPSHSIGYSRPIYDVPAGYPSAAQDYLEQELDITSYMLGPRRASVFLFRIGGMSMKDAGIIDGDIIIVDRSLDVSDGHIVVASLDGAYTCKYYRKNARGVWLAPANESFKPIKITEEREFTIFGRYNGLIRKGSGKNNSSFNPPTLDEV